MTTKTIKEWEINEKGIKSSIERVIKTKDITKLTKSAYKFVMNMSGFIAHYNHEGFMDYYSNVNDFINDLKWSSDTLRPDYYITDRYFSEGEQSEYYASKTRILQHIASLV